MKRHFLLLAALLLPLCPLAAIASATAFDASQLALTLPELKGWPEKQKPDTAVFVGIIYPADEAAITADSRFDKSSPLALFSRLLAAYRAKDLPAVRALYSSASQENIAAMLENIGEQTVLDTLGTITALTPRAFWIDAPHTGIFYMTANNSRSVLPFMLTRENGEWKFVSGSLNSPLALAFDLVNAQDLWGALQQRAAGAAPAINVAEALENDNFSLLPRLEQRP